MKGTEGKQWRRTNMLPALSLHMFNGSNHFLVLWSESVGFGFDTERTTIQCGTKWSARTKSLLNYNALDEMICVCVRVFSSRRTLSGKCGRRWCRKCEVGGGECLQAHSYVFCTNCSVLSASEINSFSEKFPKCDFLFAIRTVVSSTKVSYRVVAKIMKRAYFAF